MSEVLAPGHVAANAVVTGAMMIVPGYLPGQQFIAVPANFPACTEWVPARDSRVEALVLSGCLSRTNNPRSIQLPVMNSNLSTETSLGRPSKGPE